MQKDSFFDRTQYLDVLEKRIGDLKHGFRQNLAIIGNELAGKTSIVFKFLDRFCDNQIIILYLQTHPESLGSFAKRFIGVLLYNFLVNSAIPLKEDLDFLLKKSQNYIPRTTDRAKSILSALKDRKENNIFSELLSLCESIHQETGKHCVVIFDEFHNLEKVCTKSLYRDWARLLVMQKNTMYILLSSMQFKARNILSKHLSLLFGNFELVVVEPFDIKTSEDYLNHRLPSSGLDKGLKDFLVHFTGGFPFYLQVITESLLKSDQANLAGILENLLFDTSGILNQRFSNYLKCFLDSPHSNDYVSLLYLVSSGHNKLKDIAHVLHKTQKELKARIDHLLELDAVVRSGDFLRTNDRVFSFWLRFVYQGKNRSLTFDAKNQKAAFKEYIESMLREFLSCAHKPILDRMTELLRLFEDEVVQIEKKKFKLHRFREIKPLEFNRKTLKEGLIGRSSESLWIMALKHDALTEEDVAEFARECKKYRHKLQRKIIVALNDIDQNARLRALEEKVVTWDLNNVNQILDLFFKPRVIV